MAMTSLYSQPLLYNPTLPKLISKPQKKRYSCTISASKKETHDQNNGGHPLVDENLIILRKRIHEMKMIERNYEPPSDWIEWEKSYYTRYDSIVCEAVGFLQCQLMKTRPSLGLGMMALVAMSVPMSMAVVLIRLVELSEAVVAGLHLG